MAIPIQNIYYLLSYAWNKLEEKNIVSVDKIESNQIFDLFAKVLANGMSYLLRRGLDRGYIPHVENTGRIKGKVNFNATLKRNNFNQPKVVCEYDELSYNVLHNQIIKTVVYKLICFKELDKNIRDELILIFRKLNDVDIFKLTKRHFGLVQLHSNNYFYDFLLKICELIHDNLIISEKDGTSKFRDFIRDERQMGILFEAFVRNFYKREQTRFKVRKKDIFWDAKPITDDILKYLPKMQTDIYLESPNRKIIIDTKYYKEALRLYYDKEKIKSENLYQLLAYLTNLKSSERDKQKCEGILLYPTVQRPLDEKWEIQGHPVRIKTINLNQNWKKIHTDLQKIICI